MTRVSVHLRMAADGGLAASIGAVLFLPVFVLAGGNLAAYVPIVLADGACVVAIALLAAQFLASPLTPGSSAAARAVAAASTAWFLAWGVGTGMGLFGIVLWSDGTTEPHWQLVGLLGYAAMALVLFSVPLVTALAAQLWLATRLHHHLARRPLPGAPSRV